ncbi:DUF1385 domain-containing protein [Candidatus Microgenomates bacterium]|nr:DUF1385 domain-containing protein [Candidatus Microgenomates bacterium]
MPNKKQKIKKKKNSRSVSGEELNDPFGGIALSCGVVLRNRKIMTLAMRDELGNIELVSAKLKRSARKNRFLYYPLIRGIAFFVEALVINLLALFYKRRFIKKNLKTKTIYHRFFVRLRQYVLYIVYLALAVAIFNYLSANLQGYPIVTWDMGLYNWAVTFGYLILFALIFILIATLTREEADWLFYHGVEHKIIRALEKKGKISIDSLRKESLLDDRCSLIAWVWTMIFVSGAVSFLHLSGAPFGVVMIVLLGIIIFAFALAYELVWWSLKYRGIFYTIFIWPFTIVERIFIREPDEAHFKIGLAALGEIQKLNKRWR